MISIILTSKTPGIRMLINKLNDLGFEFEIVYKEGMKYPVIKLDNGTELSLMQAMRYLDKGEWAKSESH